MFPQQSMICIVDMNIFNPKKLELCFTSKIKDSIFMELVHVFRGNISDRDEVKIQLFDLYKKASKPDRRIIDVLINLLNCNVLESYQKRPDASC
ncbi:MAG: hypothetical protein EXX96DRAFT_544811 [Benjaminiella poitrasii]|nr:MAG: hypothetical protein EXX96DRAFT_544811 [Benjaminiella poitrasii]